MDNNKIGKFIAQLRKEKNLTQQQLGEKLFVTDKAVSKWERGISLPDISIIESLARILDVDVSELLHGEKGNKEKINVQEEVNKVLEKMKKEKEDRIKFFKNILLFIILFILIVFSTVVIRKEMVYKQYHPTSIKEGNNKYILGKDGKYFLSKNGLDEVVEIIDKTKTISNYKVNISSFNIILDEDGSIDSFNLSLKCFDNDLKYIGNATYLYDDNTLVFSYNKDLKNKENTVYTKSFSIGNISEKLKLIPFEEQIKKSNLSKYNVDINLIGRINKTTPAYDLRESSKIDVKTFDEYKKDNVGIVEPGLYMIITLGWKYDPYFSEVYRFVFEYVYGDNKIVDETKEKDTYVLNNKIKLTADSGISWVDVDVTEKEVEETLSFYKDADLKYDSWFISSDDSIPIGVFYGDGKNTKLKISDDYGFTWKEKSFTLEKEITKRIVGFSSKNNGFIGIGTDWTMGTGEEKKIFVTSDSGTTWKEIDVPVSGTSETLIDLYMYNEKEGIIFLNDMSNSKLPIIYSTIDGGKKWNKIQIDESSLPDEVTFILDISNIEKKDNEYYITVGQEKYSSLKFVFKSDDLKNLKYDKTIFPDVVKIG